MWLSLDVSSALRLTRQLLCAAVAMTLGAYTTAGAQLTLPQVSVAGTTASTRPVSAAEAAYHVQVEKAKLDAAISYRQAHYPVDSINSIVSETGAQWLTALRVHPIQGLQHDPASEVAVVAHEEAFAKSQIAVRLATPGLSFDDKAYTYLAAVRAFTNISVPERLPTAEAYLASLDAMGDSAAYWQFQARRVLVEAYYQLGRSRDVVRHGVRAIHLVPALSFYDRGLLFPYTGGDGKLYAALVDALTGQPGGLEQIKALNTRIQAAIIPTPALIAVDSGYIARGHIYQSVFTSEMTVNGMLGMQGKPIVSGYWLNRPTRDSATLIVNDGKIRVLEVGSYTCAGCLWALQAMQRIQNQFPDIQTMMLTWTLGFWGNRVIDPDETAQLTDYYLNDAKVTIPIAIWRGKKVIMEDGGYRSEDAGPNLKNYPMVSKPTIWVLDGKGTIRRIFVGYSRENEKDIIKVVQYLTREATASSPNTNTSPMVTRSTSPSSR